MVDKEDMIKLYKLDIWPQNPYTKKGEMRFKEALDKFSKLLEHEWLKNVTSEKDEVKILEVCSGTGIGGVALAKSLLERDIDIELTLLDVRIDALEMGKEWGENVLRKEVKIVEIEAQNVESLGKKFDLALMYGFSAPHFSPWDMIKLLSSVSDSLVDDGIFIMDEVDRVYSIFFLHGYARFLAEKVDENNAILSTHVGYDFKRGVFKRAYIDIGRGGKNVIVDHYFWNLAELMALSWIFFQDVDFYQLSKMSGFILAYKLRRKLKSSDFNVYPKVLEK